MRRSHLSTAIAVALFTTTAAFAARLEPIPNSRKYRDIAPYTQASSESVKIEARALLRASGSTKVDVTTGQLDDPSTAKDTIEKVQLKISTAGRIKTRNYNNPGDSGTFAVSVSGLARGDSVALHVNVRDAETNKMEVIQFTTPVRLSPDLAVTKVDAPAVVTPGQPVSIMATISEVNGDTGARAACKLYVDGTRVDDAQNIWVDAGDSVNCLFSTTFTAGTHKLRVTASSAVPSDWDKANNAADAEITARNPEPNPSTDTWTWSLYQETTHKQHTTTYSDRPPGYEDYGERTERGERSVFAATIHRQFDMTSLEFHSEEGTDGNFTADFHEYDFEAGGKEPGCRSAGFRMWLLSLCSQNGKTTVNFQRTAGRTTFLSRTWSRQYNRTTGEETWVMHEFEDEDPPFGRSQPLGATAYLDITMTDKSGTWRAEPFMTLEAYEKPEEVTKSCNEYAGVTRCTTTRTKVTGKRGSDASD